MGSKVRACCLGSSDRKIGRRFFVNLVRVYAKNIVDKQISVAVDNASFIDSAREQSPASDGILGSKILNPRQTTAREPRNLLRRIPVQFRQVFVPALVDRADLALSADYRTPLGLCMKASQHAGDMVQ